MKRFIGILIMAAVLAASFSPASAGAGSGSDIGVSKHPSATNFGRSGMYALPKYDPKDPATPVDLRSWDLTDADLTGRARDLSFANFDSRTKWPAQLPTGFDPDKTMETSRNPGLGVRSLHSAGITGKGIGIAIIDQALLVDHVEYKDRLKHYEEIHWPGNVAQMHGSAVASIAVGSTVGVAPEADLYYIAEQHGTYSHGTFDWDFTYLAQSIDRVIEINQELPADRKIRVISISVGWAPSQKGYAQVMAAVERAKRAGMFVVSSSLDQTFGLQFQGLGRDPKANPDAYRSYRPGLFWASAYFQPGAQHGPAGTYLLVPMDSRTTASPTGPNDYVFYRVGGWSWSIPYIAGLYALACQVDPDITSEKFWSVALKTGDTVTVRKGLSFHRLGKIVNPVKLIEAIR